MNIDYRKELALVRRQQEEWMDSKQNLDGKPDYFLYDREKDIVDALIYKMSVAAMNQDHEYENWTCPECSGFIDDYMKSKEEAYGLIKHDPGCPFREEDEMSYCRVGGDSDVYVIEDASGGWTCFCGSPSKNVSTRQEMINHLIYHRECGDMVPEYAIDRLRCEIAEENQK